MVAHPKFTKRTVVQDGTERIDGLLQDFLTMGHKKQSMTLINIMEPFVVESSDNRLTSTCCGDYQILITMMYFTLNGQLIENGLLMGQHMILLQNTSNCSVYLIPF